MSKIKHIVALFIVCGIIAAVVYFLPKTDFGKQWLPKSIVSEETASEASALDTLPFTDGLKSELQVLSTRFNKKKNLDVWTLGKGSTIIVYLLQAQRFIQSRGGNILYMEELHDNPNVFQAAKLKVLKPEGDTLDLELQVSENVFRSNASILAVSFQVTELTPEQIVALNKLEYPFTLLVTPFNMPEGFVTDVKHVKHKDVFLWLYMESNKLNKRHNKYRPIRIHHTEEQIGEIINEAKTAFPDAMGVATRFGEQAVEHKQLLQATFKPLEANKLAFVDLSLNKMTKVPETCRDFKIKCSSTAPYNPDNSTLGDYVKHKLKDARKNGIASMVIPLNDEGLDMAATLQKKAEAQGTSIVNLSTFISY